MPQACSRIPCLLSWNASSGCSRRRNASVRRQSLPDAAPECDIWPSQTAQYLSAEHCRLGPLPVLFLVTGSVSDEGAGPGDDMAEHRHLTRLVTAGLEVIPDEPDGAPEHPRAAAARNLPASAG